MDIQAALSIAAEVGIGVAGFSSVAVAVSARGVPAEVSARWVHLRSLLQSSFAVVLLAYAPMVISAAGVQAASLWRISSAIYLTYLAIATVQSFRHRDRESIGDARYFGVGALVALSIVLNLYNLRALVPWPYLAGLASGLMIAFLQFVFVLRSLFLTTEGAAQQALAADQGHRGLSE